MYRVSYKYVASPSILLLLMFLVTGSSFMLLLLTLMLLGLWVRYYFYKIELTEDSLLIEKGIFVKQKSEILFTKINNIELSQNLFQQYLDAGDITLKTGNDSNVEIKSIDKYSELQSKIREKIIKNKP